MNVVKFIIILILANNLWAYQPRPDFISPIEENLTFNDLIPTDVTQCKNSILINHGELFKKQLNQISMNGNLIRRLDNPSGIGVVNFAYLEYHELIVACALNSGFTVKRVLFWNTDGEFLGYGQDQLKHEPKQLYYRNILEVNGRIFVNTWEKNHEYKTYKRTLQEVSIAPNQSGYDITPVSKPFFIEHQNFNSIKSAFKHIYMTQLGQTNKLFLLGQLDRQLNILKEQDTEYVRDGFHQLTLPKEEPVESKQSLVMDFKFGRQDKRKFSFTQITGLDSLDDELIVSYTIPNPNFKWSDNKTPSPSNEAISPFINCTQRINQNGKNIGNHIEIEGAFFLGVGDDNSINYLRGTEKNSYKTGKFEIMSYAPEVFEH